MPEIVQAEIAEISRRPDPLPGLLQANQRLAGNPAGKHKGASRHPRQRAEQIERDQPDGNIARANLAVRQADDTSGEIDMLPFQTERLAFAAAGESKKPNCGERERVCAIDSARRSAGFGPQ